MVRPARRVDPHGQCNLLPVEIDLEHLHPDPISRADHGARILDEPLAQLRNVDEAVLVNPDIDERTEVGDVGDNARTDHSRHQIGDGVQVFAEREGSEGFAGIATRLLELPHDVIEGELPDLVSEVFRLAHQGHPTAKKVADPLAHLLGQLLKQGIALGVNPRIVEGMSRLGNPQEPCRQLEGLSAEPWHVEELLP